MELLADKLGSIVDKYWQNTANTCTKKLPHFIDGLFL